MTEKKSVNWGAMADVWNCFEGLGLSPNRIDEIYENIISPVFIVGSGAGLVPDYLIKKGHKVTAIDSCAEMTQLSKERGVNAECVDFLENCYNDNSFKTLILSTGTVNSRTLESNSLDDLLTESSRILQKEGIFFLAYFIANPEMEYIYDELSLNKSPSNNALLYQGKDIEEAKELFLEKFKDEEKLYYIFSQYAELISKHQKFVKKVGNEAQKKGHSPIDFISNYFSFKTFDLSKQDENTLVDRCMKYFSKLQRLTLSDNETGIILGANYIK